MSHETLLLILGAMQALVLAFIALVMMPNDKRVKNADAKEKQESARLRSQEVEIAQLNIEKMLREQLAASEQHVVELKQMAETAQKDIVELRAQVLSLVTRVQELEVQHSRDTAIAEATNKDILELQARVKVLTEERDQLRQERDALQIEVKALTAQLAQLECRVKQLAEDKETTNGTTGN